ncbi:MBL fold metallo-hydrolase [Corynebacterium felinum]|uniref:Ribonuclease BN (tRNA processing enzyme) n=1 Tax=Corynebacterium felinum TaxID=131318 RepID=A0ABU2B5X0_9CORY|nr:MBL fold metallo-hydrolase [Corynebacterium felinum]MDF5820565.1 MBL fold metallo-hydrolase [Corynebacterium felinum]MDR7353666.1 ribonuclease BN (tRNA processing enzyme) [Corynebacterium felinum]WJY95845.1 ribonuclease Z [Corynebacterium felinum]
MKVVVLGSSGSLGSPGNPASGYLIQLDNAPSIVMDLGPGALANLQAVQNPSDAHVVFSHLHPDHCLDFPSLMVWRRYHPEFLAKGRNYCAGPSDTPVRMGRLSADIPEGIDDFSDTFAFLPWEAHKPHHIDRVTITPFTAIHPIESYSLRLEENATGKVIAYSGDTAYTTELIDCARNADLFLCEATWGDTSEGKVPDMHISGAEAGKIATLAGVKHLVLTHIPPWADPQVTLQAAREHYAGPIDLAMPGGIFEV